MRGEERAEQCIETLDLARRLGDEGDLVAAGTLVPQIVEHSVGRLGPVARGRDRGDRAGVPAIDTGQGGLEVEAAERAGERAAPSVLGPRAERDRQERDEHQHVPQPPAQLPVAAQGNRQHGLAEQGHRDRDGQDEHAAPLEVEAGGAERREAEQRHAGDGQPGEWAGGLGRRERSVQRGNRRERHAGPEEHQSKDEPEQERTQAQHDDRPGPAERCHRRGREQRRNEQPDRRGEDEPGVGRAQQHTRCRQRMQAQEARAREERQ